jgi:hypothetical protein
MSDTPETDAQLTTFTSISKLKKHFVNRTGTVSAEFARKLERERDQWKADREEKLIAALVRRLFEILDTVEISDSESEFHPTVIRSCRVMHTMELNELLPKLKEAAK